VRGCCLASVPRNLRGSDYRGGCDEAVIAVRLMGGLGNQMFQYAAGRRLADVHGVPLVLDASHFSNPSRRETPRQFELGCFQIRADVTQARIPARRSKLPLPHRGSRPMTVIKERGFVFQPEILSAPDETLLDGYWQSELYFADCADAIRSDFRPREPLSERVRDLAAHISPSTVAVHIRRTDYVTKAAAARFHGVVPLGYYVRALAHIARNVPAPTLLLFSDDPSWCEDNLELGYPKVVVRPDPGRDYEDILLMSMCRHIVMANSSFSWWGAWLCKGAETVIAPSQWFRRSSVDTRDLVPARWLTI
jgi:hypothetical protein